ncbi:hypothetical protein HK405_001670, partial [Cladochytrium tenue]
PQPHRRHPVRRGVDLPVPRARPGGKARACAARQPAAGPRACALLCLLRGAVLVRLQAQAGEGVRGRHPQAHRRVEEGHRRRRCRRREEGPV